MCMGTWEGEVGRKRGLPAATSRNLLSFLYVLCPFLLPGSERKGGQSNQSKLMFWNLNEMKLN